MRKIVLIGYMGSGKSKIGQLLAEKLDFPFYDLDFLIENELEKSIGEIFSEEGEVFFRKKEHEVFKKVIESNESYVLSTGGGTPCYANNHLFLANEDVVSIYLKASIPVLVSRLKNEIDKRPLLQSLKDEETFEFIAKHLFDRSYFYNQCKYSVLTDDKSPEQIVAEINALL
ncbi:shikimate kinase [Flavobacterium terrae]|uniref:Shikimate kinase n=1 Tax=Flavobacterium terrae TaxID=415425 RepID=A0A1M6FLY0_9FLAO|nr:shikimate kinase [Flavobacterium terrae]SHI98662.1 shikimate kinase [Flavobacterium terrae]